MIGIADIEDAIRAHILAANFGLPIAWPNVPFNGAAPFISFDIVPTLRSDPTLDGTGTVQNGYIMFRVVTEEGKALGEANRKADAIARAFVYPSRIEVAGGYVMTVVRPPEPLQGHLAESKWHKPVRVTFDVT